MDGTLVRLNKYLADHGVASRRRCDELIAEGKVMIDGEVVTELGTKVDPDEQTVEMDGVVLRPDSVRRRYYLLNKPAGVVCTNEPREQRPRAVDLVTDRRKGRIYTVGRLDEDTVGLVLLTSDGEFANKVMHPRYGVTKTYLVKVQGRIDDEALAQVRQGMYLSDGRTAGARVLVQRRGPRVSTLLVTLREGKNREVRRIFARVGFKVLALRRTRIGALTDRGLKVGRWRELKRDEVRDLLAEADAPESEKFQPAGPRARNARRRRGGGGQDGGGPPGGSRGGRRGGPSGRPGPARFRRRP